MTSHVTLNQKGISFIIVTFNGAQRLPKTLANIASQELSGEIPWEVILIDNGSSDGTQEAVQKNWPLKKTPVKILRENHNQGVGLMRVRGLDAANYEYAVFVDDDNWIEKNWVSKIFEIMESHPEVGACGSFCEAVYESEPPVWFDRFKAHYAIGPEDLLCGYVPDARGWIWSAGMAIRKTAWNTIRQAGFRPHLISRVGDQLLSGEDIEICYALRLAGWKLWFDPALRFQHFVSKRKLDWNYLKKLYRGFGKTVIYFHIYQVLLCDSDGRPITAFGKKRLFFQSLKILELLMINIKNFLLRRPEKAEELSVEHELGCFHEMLCCRAQYEQCRRDTIQYVANLKNPAGGRMEAVAS